MPIGCPSPSEIAAHYCAIRAWSEEICRPLHPEDYVIQSMPDVSPTKWHLAHTSWFFETFVLKAANPQYQSLHPQYDFLFNSYYNSVGERHCRAKRGVISRPGVEDTYLYRAYVDAKMQNLLADIRPEQWETLGPIVVLGCHHEQQHQELMVTDIKHVLSENPLLPAYHSRLPEILLDPSSIKWFPFSDGLYEVGYAGNGFAFDNEEPRHRVFLEAFQIASRPVTNREYLEFMADGGYERPEFWLSAGWATVQQQEWHAPFYWERDENGEWQNFTLAGPQPIGLDEPVCHVSLFEADAYARWAGARLPTEEEWEVASAGVPIAGNFAESGLLHPSPLIIHSHQPQQMFGDVWEWTRSQYSPYPGYSPAAGALGEYNGKFMCNQFVLRGGSCATPQTHIRPTYRNFFPPDTRWQFMGFRLAKDN